MDEDRMSVEEKHERYSIASEIDNLISTNEIEEVQTLLERYQTILPELRYIGKTILHMAVDHNNLEVCQQIVQAGISVNIINEHYMTALPYAVEQGNIHIVIYYSPRFSIASDIVLSVR